MNDLEKVIEELNDLRFHFRAMAGISSSRQGRANHIESARTIEDAIALLKAQEALEPVYGLGITRCGQCNNEIDKYGGDKYCPNCGRKVKWE